MKIHGIEGAVLNWSTEWLTDRTQSVVIEGKSSGMRPVTSGVPQGSCLGPTLFLLFINLLDDQIGTGAVISKNADDCKFGTLIRSEEDGQSLQEIINKVNT